MYGGVTFCHSVFWDENICPLFGGVRYIEVSVNGGSTVSYLYRLSLFSYNALLAINDLSNLITRENSNIQ